MSLKRRNTSSPESDSSPAPKRPRPSWMDDLEDDLPHPTGREQPRTDATYGQKGAFPGLDDGDGDELFYGPASDGIEYLRMVRSEAKGVPHLLVAPKSSNSNGNINGPSSEDVKACEEDDDDGTAYEEGGFYSDGAYMSAPITTSFSSSSEEISSDPQELYYASLSAQFNLLRTTLRCSPPISAMQVLDSSHPIYLSPDSDIARQQWRLHLQTTDPHMVQLACMDAESVLEVIKLMTTGMARIIQARVQERIKRLGAWAWAVLGRCKDMGELGSEEIADIRELGKRAVGILVGIRDKSGRAYGGEREDDVETSYGEALVRSGAGNAANDCIGSASSDSEVTPKTDVEVIREPTAEISTSIEEAKARLQERLAETNDADALGSEVEDESAEGCEEEFKVDADKEVRIILDMIITVVGEYYGQRDLLEFRDIWDKDGRTR